MIIIQEPLLTYYMPCTYIPGEMWRFDIFFAFDLDKNELDELLKRGWRKFGEYFFRPNCERCFRCIPIRVLVEEFKPTKSQRRVLKKCRRVSVKFESLKYRDEIFEIYRDHSINRFGKESDKDDFILTFYTESCPSIQSLYYLGDELIAAGFIDISKESLSSVYFVFKTAYETYGLGNFSIIKEIEYAASLDLKYYYLGYYIEENSSMAYKNRFHPNEKFDWIKSRWEREE